MNLQDQYNNAMRYGNIIRTVRQGQYRFDYVVYQDQQLVMVKCNGDVVRIETKPQ